MSRREEREDVKGFLCKREREKEKFKKCASLCAKG